jgi:hypothetical protein
MACPGYTQHREQGKLIENFPCMEFKMFDA